MTDQIPTPILRKQSESSLLDIHAELRIEIWKHLLDQNNVPRSYAYTGPPTGADPTTLLAQSSPVSADPETAEQDVTASEFRHSDVAHLIRERKSMRQTRLQQYDSTIAYYTTDDINPGNFQFEPVSLYNPVPITRTHSLVLVNKQVSAEYRQVYYERTTFFLYINHKNVLRGIPHLNKEDYNETSSTSPIPNFWAAPPSLFENLRHCTMYIELGAIEAAKHPIRWYMKGALRDTTFDNHITTAIEVLIASMRQIRTIHLVWAMPLAGRLPIDLTKKLQTFREAPPDSHAYGMQAVKKDPEGATAVTNYNWAVFGADFLDVLMEKESLRRIRIVMGDNVQDIKFMADLNARGEWQGKAGVKKTVLRYANVVHLEQLFDF